MTQIQIKNSREMEEAAGKPLAVDCKGCDWVLPLFDK